MQISQSNWALKWLQTNILYVYILTTTNVAMKATTIHEKGRIEKKVYCRPKISQPLPNRKFSKITSPPAAREGRKDESIFSQILFKDFFTRNVF